MNPGITKAGNYIKEKYNSMSPKSKVRTRTIIILIILFLLFRKKVVGAVRKMFHRDINKLDVNNTNLTYERSEYFSMCSSLESAMHGTGTDEDLVYSIMMRMRTQDDWNFLQKCFGVREKEGGTFYADMTGDLKAWLADELDSGEMEEVRDILISQGVSY